MRSKGTRHGRALLLSLSLIVMCLLSGSTKRFRESAVVREFVVLNETTFQETSCHDPRLLVVVLTATRHESLLRLLNYSIHS